MRAAHIDSFNGLKVKPTSLRLAFLILVLVMGGTSLFAQNMSINTNGAKPDSSAMLDVSDTTRGFLMPRMTNAQMNNIVNPAAGLMIYNTDSSSFYYYDGVVWASVFDGLTMGSGDGFQDMTQNSSSFTVSGGSWVRSTNVAINGDSLIQIDNSGSISVFRALHPVLVNVSSTLVPGTIGNKSIIEVNGVSYSGTEIASITTFSQVSGSYFLAPGDSMRFGVTNTGLTNTYDWHFSLVAVSTSAFGGVTISSGTEGLDSVLNVGNDASGDSILNLGALGVGSSTFGGSPVLIEGTGSYGASVEFRNTGDRWALANDGSGLKFIKIDGATFPALTLTHPNGYMGLGTTNPLGKFHVVDTSALLMINAQSGSTVGTWSSLGNTSTGGKYYQFISTGSANGEGPGKLLVGVGAIANGVQNVSLILDSNNLGIGQANPSERLDVFGNVRADSLVIHDGSTSPVPGDVLTAVDASGRAYWASPGSMADNDWDTTATEVYTYKNVGIGTNSPSNKLHVFDSTGILGVLLQTADTSSVRLNMINATRPYRLQVGAAGRFKIIDANPGPAPFTIDTFSNVGISNANPVATLQIDSFTVFERLGATHFMGFNAYNDAGTIRHLYSKSVDFYAQVDTGSTATFTGIYHYPPQASGSAVNFGVSATRIQMGDSTITLGSPATENNVYASGHFVADSISLRNAYGFPSSDGNANDVLVTDGSGNVTWSSVPSDGDWTVSGGFVYNTTERFLVGTNSVPGSYFSEFESPAGGTYAIGLSVDHNYTGAAQTFGVITDIDNSGTGIKYGLYSLVRGNGSQTNSIHGTYNQIQAGNTEPGYGTYNRLVNTGTGSKTGVFNEVDASASQTGALYGVNNQLSPDNTGPATGVYNYIDNAGTGSKYGVENEINGSATQTSSIYGVYNQVYPGNTETSYGTYNFLGNGGTGVRYGTYQYVNSASTSQSYGIYNLNNHASSGQSILMMGEHAGSGSGTRYGLVLNIGAAGAGTKYGIYVNNEDYNYFSGNVGIGVNTTTAPLEVATDGSLLNGLRVSATTSATVGASIYLNGATRDWTITATNSSAGSGVNKLVFRDYSGANDIMTMETSGEVGIGTNNPTSMLEVAGDIEIPPSRYYAYSAAKTEYHSVAAPAFHLLQAISTTTIQNIELGGFNTGNSYWVAGGTSGTDAYMLAPVSLPDSAVVTDVTFYVYDNDGTYECYGEMIRKTNTTTIVSTMASTGTTGAAATPGTTSVNDNTIGFPVIDNQNYAYFLKFVTEENTMNLRIFGARITYNVYKAN